MRRNKNLSLIETVICKAPRLNPGVTVPLNMKNRSDGSPYYEVPVRLADGLFLKTIIDHRVKLIYW